VSCPVHIVVGEYLHGGGGHELDIVGDGFEQLVLACEVLRVFAPHHPLLKFHGGYVCTHPYRVILFLHVVAQKRVRRGSKRGQEPIRWDTKPAMAGKEVCADRLSTQKSQEYTLALLSLQCLVSVPSLPTRKDRTL